MATGIRADSGINNLTITNSGRSTSMRSLPTAARANAYGIRVTSNGTVTPAAGDVVTINNSGDIIVRVRRMAERRSSVAMRSTCRKLRTGR